MENISKIYLTIKELCDFENITIAQLERNLSFSEGSISKWKNSNPSCDKISAVADYFGVSLDFIAGRTSIKHVSESILNDKNIISIQVAMDRMNNDEKDKMMMLLKLSFQDKF
jgi:transcriptional regulator with XRE-family HTH domain